MCSLNREMCVHVVGKPPKGCICTQWNSGMRETDIHQHHRHRGQPCFYRLYLNGTPSEDLAQAPSGVETSPSLPPKPISLNSVCASFSRY